MKRIVIDNIPDEMYAHMVNGIKGSPTACTDLTPEQQQEAVGAFLVDYATSHAKAFAVNMAQIKAARATSTYADGLITQTKGAVQITVEEAT